MMHVQPTEDGETDMRHRMQMLL